jgi:hypothetical protein
MNPSSAFAANYDTNVQAVCPSLQINIAEPRRFQDEVSVISTELYFESLRIRRMVGFLTLKKVFCCLLVKNWD